MKNLIITLIFIVVGINNLFSQDDISFSSTRTLVSTSVDTADLVEPYDSLTFDTVYVYQFITTTILDNGDTIVTREPEISEAAFIRKMERATAQHFDRAASLQANSVKVIRRRGLYLGLLNDYGINNYYLNARTGFRRVLNGKWRVRANGVTYECKVVGDTGVIRIDGARDQSGQGNNTKVATLIPRSRKYITLDFEPGFGPDTDIVSEDGFYFVSTSENVILLFLNN